MKYSIRKPQGQSSLCAPPPPSASGLSGNSLLQILQEGVKPLLGTVGSRTGVSPRCCVPISCKELMPVEFLGPLQPPSKGFRLAPRGSQGTCSETLLSPTAQGVLLSTSPGELPEDRGRHTLPQAQGLHVCSFWVIFTYLS